MVPNFVSANEEHGNISPYLRMPDCPHRGLSGKDEKNRLSIKIPWAYTKSLNKYSFLRLLNLNASMPTSLLFLNTQIFSCLRAFCEPKIPIPYIPAELLFTFHSDLYSNIPYPSLIREAKLTHPI